MKLNKRMLATVTLTATLVAPAVTPAATAEEGPKPAHLNCEQRFTPGLDFNGTPEILVQRHLEKNCGLDPAAISQLSPEELKKVAEELKDKKGGAALQEEQINEIKDSISPDQAEALATDTPQEDKKDDASQEKTSYIAADDISAGASEVTGQVFLVGAKGESIKAIFPGGKEATFKPGDTVKLEEGLETARFTIAVPEGVELKSGDEVSFFTVPGNGRSATVIVGAADEATAPGAEGSSNAGKVIGAIAGIGGVAALIAGAIHLANNGGVAGLLQPIRDFLAQFNIHF